VVPANAQQHFLWQVPVAPHVLADLRVVVSQNLALGHVEDNPGDEHGGVKTQQQTQNQGHGEALDLVGADHALARFYDT